MKIKVTILDTCSKELRKFPKETLEDFLDAVAKMNMGISLSMPLSRKMASMGAHTYELRFKDKSDIYRVIYFVKKKEAIYMVHAFMKKTQKTPKKNMDLALKRIKRLI